MLLLWLIHAKIEVHINVLLIFIVINNTVAVVVFEIVKKNLTKS